MEKHISKELEDVFSKYKFDNRDTLEILGDSIINSIITSLICKLNQEQIKKL